MRTTFVILLLCHKSNMKLYSFNVSGTRYHLSRRNLESDSPNVLLELVQKSPKRRHFALDSNPDVFYFIHKHLQGYAIGPHLSKLSTANVTIQDIEHDCHLYQLHKLTQSLQEITGNSYTTKLSSTEMTDKENSNADNNDHIADVNEGAHYRPSVTYAYAYDVAPLVTVKNFIEEKRHQFTGSSLRRPEEDWDYDYWCGF